MTQVNNPNNYTDKQIDDALRMKGDSREVSFRYELLDRHDVRIGVLDGVRSARITYGEFNAIKRTASFLLDEYLRRDINFLTDEIEPWFILHMPDGGFVEWPLGIFLLESPGREADGSVVTREIGGYDKTIILEEDRLENRYFMSAGSSYIGEINKILSLTGITKINIIDSPLVLRSDKEFAIGTKIKEAVNDLLNQINYGSLFVDEVGFVRAAPYLEPSQRPITQIYSTKRDSIIHPRFSESLDICPLRNGKHFHVH